MKSIKYVFLSIAFLPVFMHAALEHDLMKLSRSMSILTLTLKPAPVETEEERLKKQRERQELLLKQEKERLERLEQEKLLREQEEKLRKEQQEQVKKNEFGKITKSLIEAGKEYTNNTDYFTTLTEEQFNKFKADFIVYFESVLLGDVQSGKNSFSALGIGTEIEGLLKKILKATTDTFDDVESDIGFEDYSGALNKIKEGIEEFKQVK